MVRWPAAGEAVRYALARPSLSLGLHLDLGEWRYRDGRWDALYEVVALDDVAGVAVEIDRQLDAFQRMVGRAPTHIDSHQHVHRSNPVAKLLAKRAKRLRVPVRNATPGISYCGSFYGQDGRGHVDPNAIMVDAMVEIIQRLPPGVTELGCHPGEDEDLDTDYRDERRHETETLCHPAVRAALEASGVVLGSFADVQDVLPRP
jgi:predicted glycoside hydrolase/deacetylase ChbG (UPF0249 family)